MIILCLFVAVLLISPARLDDFQGEIGKEQIAQALSSKVKRGDENDEQQTSIVFPDSKGSGQKIYVAAKGKGSKMRPSPSNNFRSDNPACELHTPTGESDPVYTCTHDFPSANQLSGMKALAVISGNFGDLTYSKYIECRALKKLILQGCGIASIQGELFKTTAHLVTLDLSGNRLAVIRQATLQGLTKLKSLNLARNEIALIEPGSFDSNQCLQELDMSDNQLIEFPNELPTSLKRVLLTNNRIQELTIPVSLPHIIELNLCSNKIRKMSALRCPKLNILCIGAFNMVWDDASLQASSLDSLRDVTFVNSVEENVFPVNVLQFLQKKLIHQLTIQDFILTQLYLPATLTHLSLIDVEVQFVVDSQIFKSCAPKLAFLDLSHSKEPAHALVSSMDVLEELLHLKQLILAGCGIHTLAWLDRTTYPTHFPAMTDCDIRSNSIDCADKSTMHVLCSANKEGEQTRIKLLFDSVTCMANGEPWDFKFCTVHPPLLPSKGFELLQTPAFRVEVTSEGHREHGEMRTQDEIHEDTWKMWIIIASVIVALLVILTVIFVICYYSKKKDDKYGEFSRSEGVIKREAQPMLPKNAK